MKVDAGASSMFATQRNHATARTDAQDFSALLNDSSADTRDSPGGDAARGRTDFTGMTRQGLMDWMNERIRSGQMTLDESSPFLDMTLKISAATGQPVDMATDMTRIDFTEKARQGIEGALSRFDVKDAKRLQAALDMMLHQGADSRI